VSNNQILAASLGCASAVGQRGAGSCCFSANSQTARKFAIVLAACGVVVLASESLVVWISLLLAASFGMYGMRCVKGACGLLPVTCETTLLPPLALVMSSGRDCTIQPGFGFPPPPIFYGRRRYHNQLPLLFASAARRSAIDAWFRRFIINYDPVCTGRVRPFTRAMQSASG
jgi:hypothetical protein